MKYLSAVLFSLFFVLPLAAQHTDHIDREIKQFETQKVESRKVYYANIPEKVTKVVLSEDNSMTDLLYRNAVEKGWYVSAYEFCSHSEFQKIKCDTNYYFLLRIRSSKKEEDPTMEFMTFVKGSPEAAESIEKMPEVLSLPILPAGDQEGRIFAYLPAYVNIFQTYIQAVARGVIYPSFYKTVFTRPLEEATDKTVLFRADDFSYPVTQEMLDADFKGQARLVSQEEIDDAIASEKPNTLVSLIVAQPEPVKGAYCYKMLISTDTYDLYFYRKHRMSGKRKAGFVKDDYRRIVTPFIVNNGRK